MFLNAGGNRLFPMKCDFVKTHSESVPAGALRRLGPNHMGFRHHSHSAPAKGAVHQAYFEFDRRARFDVLRAMKENSAGTDVGCSERQSMIAALAGNPSEAQGQAKLGACIGAPLFDRAHRMRRNARDAFRLGPSGPRRRFNDRSRGAGGQFCHDGGIAVAGIRSVHNFLMLSSAHTSPRMSKVPALLADTILRADSRVNFVFQLNCPIAQLPRRRG